MTILNLNFFRVFFCFFLFFVGCHTHYSHICNSPEIKYPKTSSHCFFPQNVEILPKIHIKVPTPHNIIVYGLFDILFIEWFCVFVYSHGTNYYFFGCCCCSFHVVLFIRIPRFCMGLHSNFNSIPSIFTSSVKFWQNKKKRATEIRLDLNTSKRVDMCWKTHTAAHKESNTIFLDYFFLQICDHRCMQSFFFTFRSSLLSFVQIYRWMVFYTLR